MDNRSFSQVRHFTLIITFYAVLAISLLAPSASNQYLFDNSDAHIHVASIIQAKMALKEGQFPIRVAPWEYHGWGYAVFQFYGPLAYTVGGLVHGWIVPNNPYIAFKIVIFLALVMAGFFWYRLVNLLCASPPIALLTGFLYISAPYLLININTRGDFCEALAQCLVPVVLYYSYRVYSENINIRVWLFCMFAWFALLTTHIVTFVYVSFFMGLFFLILTSLNFQLYRRLFVLGTSYIYACLVAMWYLAPIEYAKSENLLNIFQLVKFVPGSGTASAGWTLHNLSTLLSVTAVGALNAPSIPYLQIPLYFSVGWPILLAYGAAIYLLVGKTIQLTKMQVRLFTILLGLSLLAFLMVWSPFNIFHMLPKLLWVGQFSYRILSQLMWLGALTFAITLSILFKHKKLDIHHVLIGILLFGLASSSWLPTERKRIAVKSIIAEPGLGYARTNYLTQNGLVNSKSPNLIPVQSIENNCSLVGYKLECNLTNNSATEKEFQLPLLYYSKMLDIRVNQKKIIYGMSLFAKENLILTTIKLQPGIYNVVAYFRGFAWANWISFVSAVLALFGLCFSFFKKTYNNK
jgi:hypothetical protein